MNKKGFTLIEMLVVVVIISMIVILAFPKITNTLNNFNTKTNNLTISMIDKAINLYIDDNKNEYPEKAGNSYCISFDKLISNEYLKERIEYDGKDITKTKVIKVTYTNQYNIELVNSNACMEIRQVCKAVDEETKTTGNIPKGDFEPGDEYICEVKPGTSYTFFVVSTEDDKVNLLLDRNINSDGTLATSAIKKASAEKGVYNLTAWISNIDYGCNTTNCVSTEKGPITLINFLNSATSSWITIPNMNETYADENGHYTGVAFASKARALKESEVKATGCKTTGGTCPLWMINYLQVDGNYSNFNSITGQMGYWTLPTSAASIQNAYGIARQGKYQSNNAYNANIYGVRPVISLSKAYLIN